MRRKQCPAGIDDGRGVTDHCCLDKGHKGAHLSAFVQTAWVVTTGAKRVPYDIAAAEAGMPSGVLYRSNAEHTMARIGLRTDCVYTSDVLADRLVTWLLDAGYLVEVGKRKNGDPTYFIQSDPPERVGSSDEQTPREDA